MRRHVVLIHRYFAPDTPPYATILATLANHLGDAGFRVTVLTCQPSYNRSVVRRAPARETWASGVRIVRWPVLDDRSSSALKVINLVWFCLRLLTAVPRLGRVDVIMAASTPPLAVAGVASLLARGLGAAFVYHKQDIYPEVTVGLGRQQNWVVRVLRGIDARTDRRASRVVVLSDDMAKTICDRGVAPETVHVVNNFDPWPLEDESERADSVPEPLAAGGDSPLRVVFAGNLGRFQGLEAVFDALVQVRDEPIDFHFFGDGALKPDLIGLIEREQLSRVRVHGFRPPREVASFLADNADLGLVSLAAGVIRAAYPSKTLSYLRQGTPMLALVEGDSELGRTIVEQRIGWQAEPGDAQQLANVLRCAAHDRSGLIDAPYRARALYEREFSQAVRLAQWERMFEELVS